MVTRNAPPPDLLGEGHAHQLAGRLVEAAECYALAIDAAVATNAAEPWAEGLRRLGIVHHLRGETATGMHYCERSQDVARTGGLMLLAAEATMALANMACEQGRIDDARALYQQALALAPKQADLVARVELNLGIVSSVQGKLVDAMGHFGRALQASETAHNVLGRARAHHNIGMVHADLKEWHDAYRSYDQAAGLAQQGGDYHLCGLCMLNRAEIDLAHEHYDAARRQAEAALTIFDRLGARADMADASRMLGTALRFLNRPTLAESRLRSALETARSAGAPLTEAESCRDIAYLFAGTGRKTEAVGFIDRATALFQQLGATLDVAAMAERRAEMLAA